MGYNNIWTQGLTDQEKPEVLRLLELEADSPFLKRLLQVLDLKKQNLETSERTLEAYDNPNWAYKQAHNNGAIQMISFIEKLIKGIV